MSLTKAKIVEAISKQTGYPKNKSSEMVEIILEHIKKSLESVEDVLISGFVKFRVREKKERRGRIPATGEDMMVAPLRVLRFTCSERLRNRANG